MAAVKNSELTQTPTVGGLVRKDIALAVVNADLTEAGCIEVRCGLTGSVLHASWPSQGEFVTLVFHPPVDDQAHLGRLGRMVLWALDQAGSISFNHR